jgi:hypothetical protein
MAADTVIIIDAIEPDPVCADPTIDAMLKFTRLELIEREAILLQAVEVVFDAIPDIAWIRA